MKKEVFEKTRSRHPWLITFADLLLVMLVLFVLMFSYSKTDIQKFKSVVHSFQSHSNLYRGSAPADQDDPASDDIDEDAGDEETTVSKDLEDQLAEMIAREERIQEILDFVDAYAKEHGLKEKMTVSPTAKGIEVVLPEIMLFPSGQADLLDEAIVFLDDMAPLLAEISNPIEVEGHTDNRPISTVRFPSNWDLSTARANEVIRYLIEEHGLDPKRFKAVGYGEHQPIASNDTEQGKSQNRRVVMVITNEESSP